MAHPIAGDDGAGSRPEFQSVLLDLVFDQGQGEGGAQHRTVDPRQHVRHAADVILVAVGQDQRRHPAAALVEVVEGRDDEVHPRQIGLGEHRAGVDEDGGLPTRHGQHVQPELAEPTERHDIDRRHCLRVTRHGHRNPSQARTRTRRRGRTPTGDGVHRPVGHRRHRPPTHTNRRSGRLGASGGLTGGLRGTIAQPGPRTRSPRRPQVPRIQRAAASRGGGAGRRRRRAARTPDRRRRRCPAPSARC